MVYIQLKKFISTKSPTIDFLCRFLKDLWRGPGRVVYCGIGGTLSLEKMESPWPVFLFFCRLCICAVFWIGPVMVLGTFTSRLRGNRGVFFARLPSDFFWNWCWNSHQTVGWVFRFIFPASLPVYSRVSDFQYFQFFFGPHNKKFSWHRDHAGWKERKILDGYMSSRKNLTVEILKTGNSSFVHDLLSICEGGGPSPRWLVTGLRQAP